MIPRTGLQREYNALCDLAGTDKNCLNHNFAGYNYMDHYARLLGGLAQFAPKAAPRILEIGVLGGKSLALWRQLWPNATLVGLDSTDLTNQDCSGAFLFHGQQKDVELLRRINDEHGPFDLVIDDGSHAYYDMLHTFMYLAPRMRPHGFYVMEDTNVGWPMPNWPGMTDSNCGPNSTTAFHAFIGQIMQHIQMRSSPLLSIHWYFGMVAFQIADTIWSPEVAPLA